MRAVLILICVAGFGLVAGAFVLAVDTAVTTEDRMAVQDAIAERAAANEEMGRREGRADVVGRLARFYHTFSNGIFRGLPVAAADILPDPAAGWTRRPYLVADAEALSGRPLRTGPLASTTENRIFKRYAEAAEGKASAAAATYQNGAQVILLSAHVSMEAFRAADEGEIRRAQQVTAPYATLAGVPVSLETPFHTNHVDGSTFTAGYRHFSIDLDDFVRIEVLTDAADSDVLALLAGIDMEAVQKVLPVPTGGYIPQSGVALVAAATAPAAPGG